MNVKNIKALAKKLRRLRHEEHYNQSRFVQQTACGTACCIAGHAALLAGYKPLGSGSNYDPQTDMQKAGDVEFVADVAERFLGLTGYQAGILFTGDPAGKREVHNISWPEEFAIRWQKAHRGPKVKRERPSRIAADLLESIASGKVRL